MFGYIRVFQDELKLKEYRLYQQYYCALCKQIGQYSQFHRLFLSYDMVFFAILLGCGADEFSCAHEQKPIKCHGGIKCFGKCTHDNLLQYVSAFSILLQYQKIKNDVIDGEISKKIPLKLLSIGYKKVAQQFPALAKTIETTMEELLKLETENCSNIETLTNCFAEIFRQAITQAPQINHDIATVMGHIVYHVIAWVYLYDMYDDMSKDKLSKDFNPLNEIANSKPQCEIAQMVYDQLAGHIDQARVYLQILSFSQGLSVIENILYYGLPHQMQKFKAFL